MDQRTAKRHCSEAARRGVLGRAHAAVPWAVLAVATCATVTAVSVMAAQSAPVNPEDRPQNSLERKRDTHRPRAAAAEAFTDAGVGSRFSGTRLQGARRSDVSPEEPTSRSRFSSTKLRRSDRGGAAPKDPRPGSECETDDRCADDAGESGGTAQRGDGAAGTAGKRGARDAGARKQGKKTGVAGTTKRKPPSTSRKAEKRAETGLKRGLNRTQTGIATMFRNLKRAGEALESVAPGIGPQPANEDDVDLDMFSESEE